MDPMLQWIGPIDPRNNGYFLVHSAYVPLTVIAIYLYVVLKLLPNWMRDRKAYELKNAVMMYNWFQIIINGYVFVEGVKAAWNISPFCAPIDPKINSKTVSVAKIFYYYYVLKLIDTVDTVLYRLRKKDSQVSFLHVYHHVCMLICGWVGCRYYPGGQGIYISVINTFIHVIMYFYYFLTSWDSSYKQNIWWKKYLTQLQLCQHLFLTVVFTMPLLDSKCTYTKMACYMSLPNCYAMIILFSNFYWKNYIAKKKVAKM